MALPAILTQALTKQYRIGEHQRYRALRDSVADLVRAPVRYASSTGRRRGARANGSRGDEFIWALNGVTFEVQEGEAVGVIGRNGAGKSTLLKILSRITKPTSGSAEIHGRVGSLLEVGTGFHPELTGRENVYLNGAILGMQKAEIKRKFDEIVAFAEIERFLDTPVKRYSSGMELRLAFAVAAHLQPEILMIDEVLAVGDASFQRKCLDKMEQVGSKGRTVLFVSHNMPAITRLCSRTILLDEGKIVADGPSPEVAAVYLRSGLGTTGARAWPDLATAPGDDVVRLSAVRVRREDGQVVEAVDIRAPLLVEMEFYVLKPTQVLVPNYHVYNEEGVCVFVAIDQDPAWRGRFREPGRYVSTARFPGNFLSEGGLTISVAISKLDPVVIHVFEPDVVAVQVIDSRDGDSARGDYAGHIPGVVRPLLNWETTFTPREEITSRDTSRLP